MEEYTIKLNGIPICKVYIEAFDEYMGVKSGKYIPFQAYKKIEPIIKKYSKLCSKYNMTNVIGSWRVKRLEKKIYNLNFKVYRDKEEIRISHIQLFDFSDALKNEAREASIFLM